MSPVGFLPVRLQGFYGWSIFMRSWIYFFGSHFGFSYGCCRFWVLCGCVSRRRHWSHVNAHKTEYMCFNQADDIYTLDGTSLKLVDKFTYLGSSVSSTEKDIDMRLTKAWTAIDKLSVIWKSDLTDKMKRSFFQAVVVSILLYGCTTWTLTKRLEKKLDGNYTRMLRAILNKS